MKQLRPWLIALSIAISAVTPAAEAQTAIGSYPFGSFTGSPDVINLGNLNVHWDIPIRNKPGRGTNFTYDVTYDSSIWTPVPSGSSKVWQPASNWGWQGLSPAGQVYARYSMTYTTGNCGQYGTQSYQEWSYNGVSYFDQNGVQHTFNVGGTYYNSPGGSYCPPNGAFPSGTITATDGAGMTLKYSIGSGQMSLTFYDKTGTNITPPIYENSSPTSTSYTQIDGNGNEITMSNGSYTDTLGTTALAVVGSAPSNTTLSYVNKSGSFSQYVVSYAAKNIKTYFNCSGVTEYTASNVYLVNSIELPDGRSYQFQYEQTPNNPSYTTGRISSVTLPTGGTITYNYTFTGSNDGVVCANGSTAELSRTTPDTGSSQWQYVRSSTSGQWVTTITAPLYNGAQDTTSITFLPSTSSSNLYEIERQLFSGSSTLKATVLTCYETNDSYCSSTKGDSGTVVTLPITRLKRTTQWPSSSGISSGYIDTYDSYGYMLSHEIHDYAAGATFGGVLQNTSISYSSTYFPNGGEAPVLITVTDGQTPANTISRIGLAYGTITTSTTGTPQHLSNYSSKGNLIGISRWVAGTTELSASFSYYDTGNLLTATDYNRTSITTYTYGASSCGNSFVTGTSTPVKSPSGTTTATLTTSTAWDCNGGVPTSSTDANSNQTTYNYGSDPYWRLVSVTDPAQNVLSYSYPTTSSPTTASRSLTFNSSSSVANSVATADSLGRAWLIQQRQGPAATNYDSVAVSYDALGRTACQTEVPYSAAEGSYTTPTTSNGSCTTYDALGRPSGVTDAGGGSIGYSYNPNTSLLINSTLVTIGPAPTGENAKQRLLNYNGAGQLASVCEITASLSEHGSCGAGTGYNGYLTQYTYDGPNLIKTQQNIQPGGLNVQTRNVAYDGWGRKVSETIPEWSAGNGTPGTTTYTYDSDTTCGSSSGDLVKAVDNDGNVICNSYDSLHRLLTSSVNSGPYATSTPTANYVYDSATCNTVQMQNAAGNLAEAFTTSGGSKLTDLCFSNTFSTSGATQGGVISKIWESTPHSGSYFLTTDTYYPNGALGNRTTSYGSPNLSIGLDGEGRPNTATDTTHSLNLITATSYNAASASTGVTYGNGDSDTFGYDSTTNRPTSILNTVTGGSPFTVTTNLSWNQNWSLKQMQVADTNDATKNQTCTYAADDLKRLVSVNCGSSTWAQTFSYDPFGNIKKTGTGGSTSYSANYSELTNQVSSGISPLPGYDKNGNQLNSTGLTSISWNAAAQPVSVTALNGSAYAGTFDALGRIVEIASGSTYTQFVYGPGGAKIAAVKSGSLQKGLVALPGGETAVYNSGGLNFIRHADWLGSSRLATTWSHGVYSKVSYAPFGETYDEAGANPDRSFTGEDQDTVTSSGATGIYDFMFRKYDPSAGRWLSPDPYGWDAVDGSDPQSMNRYSYVKNRPMNLIDLLGLDCIYVDGGGMVSVDDSDIGYSDCENNGGNYVDGTVDPGSVQVTNGVLYYSTEEWGYTAMTQSLQFFYGDFGPGASGTAFIAPTGPTGSIIGGSGSGGQSAPNNAKQVWACRADAVLQTAVGFIPFANAVKLGLAVAGVNINVFQNLASGKSLVTLNNPMTTAGGVNTALWGANTLATTYQVIMNKAADIGSGAVLEDVAEAAKLAGGVANVLNVAAGVNSLIQCGTVH